MRRGVGRVHVLNRYDDVFAACVESSMELLHEIVGCVPMGRSQLRLRRLGAPIILGREPVIVMGAIQAVIGLL